MILDGRNRARACEAAQVDPRYELLPPDVDPLAFIIDKNLKRRHLNESQRAMAAAKIARLGQGARTDLSPIGEKSQADRAGIMNVGKRTVERADDVLDRAAPEVVKAVERGKLSVSAAAQSLALTPDKQREIAARAEAGEERAARNVIKRETRNVREDKLAKKQHALPDKKFGVIVADPHWGRTVYSEKTGMDRHAANHYPVERGTLETQDDKIKALAVGSIAAPDTVLGLWCTEPWRGEAVARAWGFDPVGYFVWVKDIIVRDPSGNGMLHSGRSAGRCWRAGGRAAPISALMILCPKYPNPSLSLPTLHFWNYRFCQFYGVGQIRFSGPGIARYHADLRNEDTHVVEFAGRPTPTIDLETFRQALADSLAR
jgi:hypothetical protein